jgi:hypothetical protein
MLADKDKKEYKISQLLKYMSYRKGFLMKKITFLFIIPLLCNVVLVSSQKDTSTWAPKPQRVVEDRQRLVLQVKTLFQRNNSRSPSPRPKHKKCVPQKEQVSSIDDKR